MDHLRSQSFRTHLPPAVLFVSLSALYLVTLAPGLTWAHAGSDGGDLASAAATGGIAHPTGYPLYLLLARLFQLLPLGSLAYRTNLMSALFSALAAVLVYRLVVRSYPAWPGGLAAGYAFGLAPLVWSQAVITEVYALQAFLILSVFEAYAAWPVPFALDRWRGLLLGLALGNHITTALLAPPALLLGSIRWKTEADESPGDVRRWPSRFSFDRAALRRQLAWFGAGLCLYLILPLRALARPPVNWGNPITLGRLWWLVSGQLYYDYSLPEGLGALWERVHAWAALLLEQFGLPGLVLGLSGLVLFSPEKWAAGGRASRLSLLSGWTALVFSLFAIFYRSEDSFVYLVPVALSFAIWIGTGISGLVALLPRPLSRLGWALGVIMAAYFIGRAAIHFPQVDASRDRRAEDFGRAVLAEAPSGALVFAEGDKAVFALWYFHFALEERPDLAVVASDLLHFDWYTESLQASYPSLVLPGPLPFPETVALANPARAVCYVRYTDRAEIACARPGTVP